MCVQDVSRHVVDIDTGKDIGVGLERTRYACYIYIFIDIGVLWWLCLLTYIITMTG